jgi:hypothetical protein
VTPVRHRIGARFMDVGSGVEGHAPRGPKLGDGPGRAGHTKPGPVRRSGAGVEPGLPTSTLSCPWCREPAVGTSRICLRHRRSLLASVDAELSARVVALIFREGR